MIRPLVLAAGAVCLAGASLVGWSRTEASPTSAGSVAASTVTSADAPDGATVFRVKGCAACHAGPDTTPQYALGYPDLTQVATWAGTRRPGLTAAGYVRESIRTPDAFLSPSYTGGNQSPMPTLNLTDRELDAVLAYLLNL